MAAARLAACLTALLLTLVSFHAHAEVTKAQCIQSNTNAQSLRRDGKLGEAREQLRFCSQTKCPGLVVTDCVKRLDELETAQPTVVFEVIDTSGQELNDVAVSMDGQRLIDRLTGAAVEVDLGEHVLTFASEGRPQVQQKFVFREGEKGRRLRVTLEGAPGSAAAPAQAASRGAPSEPSSSSEATESGSSGLPPSENRPGSGGSSQRTIGYLVGGAGLAGLAVGGVFGYLTIQDKKDQTDNCSNATTCPNYGGASTAHQNGELHGAVSTVAFIVGGAATVTGLVLVLTAPARRTSAARSLTVRPSAGPDGAGLAMLGSF